MTRCSIALGGNLGNTQDTFEKALTALRVSDQQILAVSQPFRTPAMGSHAGSDFLNAAALIETPLEPFDFLNLLHQIENDLGRKRSNHWGPRIIDLDLLLYDSLVLDENHIVVPHPTLWYRRFVLEPLAEVAGSWAHPCLQQTVVDLLAQLNKSPLQLVVADATSKMLAELHQRLTPDWDSDQFVLLTEQQFSGDVFATIAPPNVDNIPSRTQPSLESGRIVRLPFRPDDVSSIDHLMMFLRDFLTAAIPE